ncbi:MAG TPA: hypothetical protein PLK31_16100, partial [Chloroflexota bacterium]|nr:hypothetical protein [Chloroflexota bacterium]
TTFLKHVALQTIKGQMGEKIPIFIGLWRLANSKQELMPYIVEQFRICGFPEAEPFVREVLKDGRAIVLFDGLDEVRVENEQRDKLITAVEDFGREFRDSQVFITCRLAVTDYTFDGFRYVEMADFNEGQMKTFVFRWFQHDMAQRDACWEALKADHNKSLRELAQVPLLLSLLCLTYEKRNEFPQERDEIYKEATDALLNDWDASRRIKRGREFVRENAVYENLTLKHKQKLLAHVAYQSFADGQYFIKVEDLAQMIEAFLQGVPKLQEVELDGVEILRVMEAQHGIFVERAHTIHSFSHLTLQEYYAARYIVENEADGTLPRLMQNVGDKRWREVFLLTAGMLSDATDFGKRYLKALQQMVVGEKELIALLQWGVERSAVGGWSPLAGRTFYIFLNHSLDLDRTVDFVLTLDDALKRVLTLEQDHTFTLSLDLAHDLDRVRAFGLNLDGSKGFTLDIDLVKGLAQARTRALSLPSPYALDYLLSMFLYVAQILTLMRGIAMDDELITRELSETAARLDQFCRDADLPALQAALAALPLPGASASDQELQTFTAQLGTIARTHRDLGHEWNLSGEQVKLLEKYLQANLLFVECLNLAYVPDRAAIENQILLPPTTS